MRRRDPAPDTSVQLRYRFHRQSSADFYQRIYDDPNTEYVTDDPKLSSFITQTIGVKLDLPLARLGIGGDLAAWRADLVLEYINQSNRFGDAVAGSFAITIPFQY